MFKQLAFSGKGRQNGLTAAFIALHLILLVALIWPRRAIFVAPSSLQQGLNGQLVTPIYFNASAENQSAESQTHIYLPTPRKKLRLAQQNVGKDEQAANQVLKAEAGPRAGSPLGTLATGTLYGQEVRPALPVVSHDPVFGSEELASAPSGSVVVEITIDETGKIVEKKVTQSLSPAIDTKVLAALEEWRFLPATRDGVPIPSKQDVYYHFPR